MPALRRADLGAKQLVGRSVQERADAATGTPFVQGGAAASKMGDRGRVLRDRFS